ncbi:MAG TPA: Gfo/Idh/MocA family oxidoreductase [Balneolaceae bacterium]|nr:Gfo/Idh/MocA family oxidoreductase [Balneolaceae bacterium]
MDKINWGILSTAKIGVEKVIPALQKSQHGEVVAIASRSKDRARKAADQLGIATAYGSYEELLQDTRVDAIYNPLPNHLHVPWTIKALEAGKHVLCEKPIGLSAEEARELARKSRQYPDLKVMEAFMYRFHPQWQKAKQLINDGQIGTLRTIQSVFSYFNDDPDDIRNQPDIGGGGLMDIGCYNISLSRFIFGAEPIRLMGDIEFDPDLEIDRLASGIMEFEDGTSSFICGTQLAPDQGVTVYGTSGRIEIDIPFNMPPDEPATIWLYAGGDKEKITFDPADQYTLQGDAFASAILDDTDVPTPLDDAIANMAVIDAVFESDEKDAWIQMNR